MESKLQGLFDDVIKALKDIKWATENHLMDDDDHDFLTISNKSNEALDKLFKMGLILETPLIEVPETLINGMPYIEATHDFEDYEPKGKKVNE